MTHQLKKKNQVMKIQKLVETFLLSCTSGLPGILFATYSLVFLVTFLDCSGPPLHQESYNPNKFHN